ncbi:MAG: DUF1294 domain-containing protein [Solobacterium sp.]|nr:DUF1294 domain-containing protein [Solobacterium sp.]
MKYLLYYLVIANLLSFAMFGMDKRKAKKGKWRIPEKRLMLSALIGGSIGALCGMKLFHHKTLKGKFAVGIPAILLLQIFGACWVIKTFGIF